MPADRQPNVYLLDSRRNGTLYLGVTSNLRLRIAKHRDGTFAGFSRRSGVQTLVGFEQHASIEHAIQREKRMMKWLRPWKLELIERDNLSWRDLAEHFGFPPRARIALPRKRILQPLEEPAALGAFLARLACLELAQQFLLPG